MRERLALLSFVLGIGTTAAITSCSGPSRSVPVSPASEGEGNVSADPNAVRLPNERIGSRGADRTSGQTLPNPDSGSGSGNDSGTENPTTPTPTPPPPQLESPSEPAPESSSAGQILNNVSTYCSNKLTDRSETSMLDVDKLKFHFFNKNRSDFRAYTVWDKSTSALPLKNYLKQKKAILPPEFTGLADGIYDVLICKQSEEYCDFVQSFSPYSLYNAIMLGDAYGVVGIVHLHISSGKITSYDNAWFLYPSSTTEVTCTHSS